MKLIGFAALLVALVLNLGCDVPMSGRAVGTGGSKGTLYLFTVKIKRTSEPLGPDPIGETRKALQDPKVAQLLADRFDLREESAVGPLGQQYQIRTVPTLVAVTGGGSSTKEWPACASADELATWLAGIR